MTKLQATIADGRRHGGDYARLAASDERIVAKRPTGPGDNAACAACTEERWPGGLIASVLAPGQAAAVDVDQEGAHAVTGLRAADFIDWLHAAIQRPDIDDVRITLDPDDPHRMRLLLEAHDTVGRVLVRWLVDENGQPADVVELEPPYDTSQSRPGTAEPGRA